MSDKTSPFTLSDIILSVAIIVLLMAALVAPQAGRTSERAPKVSTSQSVEARISVPEKGSVKREIRHIVTKHDTLAALVIRFCGGHLGSFTRVVRDNELADPNVIHINQVLVFKDECLSSPERAKTQNVSPGKFAKHGAASQEKRFLKNSDPEKLRFRQTLLARLGLKNADCLYVLHTGRWQANTLKRIECIRENYGDVIRRAAREHRLPAALIEAIIHQESGGRPDARSPTGCKGIMQFESRTARGYGVTDVYDPFESIPKGAHVLADYIRQFRGDLDRGIASYNQGPGSVRDLIRQGGNTHTLPYVVEVKKVLRLLESQAQTK